MHSKVVDGRTVNEVAALEWTVHESERIVRAQQSSITPDPRSAQSPRITVGHSEQAIWEMRSECSYMNGDAMKG